MTTSKKPTAPKKTPTKKRKPTTPTTRARRGEKLLLTCSPILGKAARESAAAALVGILLSDEERYFSVVDVRIAGNNVYGMLKEMYEAAPYMFAPMEERKTHGLFRYKVDKEEADAMSVTHPTNTQK